MPEGNVIPLISQRPLQTARAALGRNSADCAAVRSLYIHVPFCFHKCHYCDFYSIVDTQDRQEIFVKRLISELQTLSAWSKGLPLRTIFVGGGTPSLLRPALWKGLLESLRQSFNLMEMGAGPGEFTVECNPETVSLELMDIFVAGGVNRVSVGAQSFESRHLKTLERWHDPANVSRAILLAREAGISRQNIDLIFGVPGETLDDWKCDLEKGLSLGTEHMSCYSLVYEPRTEMTARLKRGEFKAVDSDTDAEMFELTESTLAAAGLEQYEVSNYAKRGAECRHNLAYWNQEQWLAAGPAASAFVAGYRYKNSPRLDDYLSINDEGFAPIVDLEPPDALRALREKVMTGLRIRDGIDLEQFLDEADHAGVKKQVQGVIDQYVATRDLVVRGTQLAPTVSGIRIADAIAVDFFIALDRADPRM
jgi:oxygen-independent coproporphyrinogen-3 oxidase